MWLVSLGVLHIHLYIHDCTSTSTQEQWKTIYTQSFTWNPWWLWEGKFHFVVPDSVHSALKFLRALTPQHTAIIKMRQNKSVIKLFLVSTGRTFPQLLHLKESPKTLPSQMSPNSCHASVLKQVFLTPHFYHWWWTLYSVSISKTGLRGRYKKHTQQTNELPGGKKLIQPNISTT